MIVFSGTLGQQGSVFCDLFGRLLSYRIFNSVGYYMLGSLVLEVTISRFFSSVGYYVVGSLVRRVTIFQVLQFSMFLGIQFDMLLISGIFRSAVYYDLWYLVRYVTNFWIFRSVCYYVLGYLVRYVTKFQDLSFSSYYIFGYLVRYVTNFKDRSFSRFLCSWLFSLVYY